MSTLADLALDSEDWQVASHDGSRAASLLVELRRRAYVLPYFRLVYAEGHHSQLRIAFGSHLVTVTGYGLTPLLTALSAQQLIRVSQPAEHEAKFDLADSRTGRNKSPLITGIAIEPF
jgi:hypothetical protein